VLFVLTIGAVAGQAVPPAGPVNRIIGDVSGPGVRSRVEPEYTKEARDAHLMGTVYLSLVVGKDGRVRDMKVVGPLGAGLEQKAMEAVRK
jgi:outer membrane biosynthesis protein TonB